MAEEGEDAQGTLVEERVTIIQLQSEQARKKELLERLKQKTTALKNEYEQRKVELEGVKEDLRTQTKKQKEANKASEGGEANKAQAISLFMQSEAQTFLRKCIPAMAEIEEEEEDDNQGPQQTKKDAAGDEKSDKWHETVLVSYVNVGDKTEEFKVSYRIDKGTTVEQLHKDACAYWGCSGKEYELRKIKEGKLTPYGPEEKIWKICGPEERSQLHLIKNEDCRRDQDIVKKLNLSVFSSDKPKADADNAEVKSIKRARVELDDMEEPFVAPFKQWPGIYWLLKSRYRIRPSRHQRVIKCRDLVIYGLLALLSALIIQYRSATMFYWMREGAYEALSKNVAEPHRPDFETIVVYEDIWTWLGGPFHRQVFDNTSMLYEFYEPVGRVRLRQQKSKKVPCLRPKAQLVVSQPCYAPDVSYENQLKDEQIINTEFWISPNSDGRFAVPNPLVYMSAPASTRPLPGLVENTYDGGGYMVDYDLAGNKTSASSAFLQDLPIFKKYWLSPTTRMFIVELTLANYHMGGYVFCVFLIELAPSGAIQTSSTFTPFHIGKTSGDNMADNLDWIRLILVVGYCLVIKVYVEIKHKHGSNTSGLRYVLSLNGFVDMSIVAIFVTIFWGRIQFEAPFPVVRTGGNSTSPEASSVAFRSHSRDAFRFEQLGLCEAIFFFLICLRFATLMRVSQTVFEYWKMFSSSLRMFAYFCLMFFPILLGCVFLAHAIWSPYFYQFSTPVECIVTLLLFIRGDLDVMALNERVRIWTLIFVAYFFIVIISFFMNGFLAITTHAYFNTQLLYGKFDDAKVWSRDQWIDWATWTPVKKAFSITPGICHIPPKREVDSDEGEEDSSDDDEGEKKAD